MSDINDRLNRLGEWRETFKHMRGRHDQRSHNRWPAGYQAQVYEPVGRSGSRREEFANQNTLRRSQSSPSGGNAVVGLVIGNTNQTVGAIPTGDQLHALVANKYGKRPSTETLTKYLFERGLALATATASSRKLAHWAKGENFFSDMDKDKTPMSEKDIQSRSSGFQRAYVAALQKYMFEDGLSAKSARALAENYAKYIEHLTGPNSPYALVRDMNALQNIENITAPVSDRRLENSQFDINADTISQLRRMLAIPRKLWEKYRPGVPAKDIVAHEDIIPSVYGDYSLSPGDKSDGIVLAMMTGSESIFGHVADMFPEMQPHLRNVLLQMQNGYTGFKMPSNMISEWVAFAEGRRDPADGPPNSDYFSNVEMYDDNGDLVPYQQMPAEPMRQVGDGEWVYDVANDIMVPKEKIDLAQALDEEGRNASIAAVQTRTQINSEVFEQRMRVIDDLSRKTGIPVDVISAVMSYWQHGSQMVNGEPIPTLVRLQDAAADLFGLQLGDDGQKLSPFQQFLMSEVDRVVGGGAIMNYDTSQVRNRTETGVEHLFKDFFEANYTADSERTVDYAFLGQRYESSKVKRLDDPVERAKLTPEEISKLEDEREEVREHNEKARLGVIGTAPGSPYATSQQARMALLKAIYDKTQQLLAEKGIRRATLYRSVSFTQKQLDALQKKMQETEGPEFSIYDENGEFDPSTISGRDISLPRNAMESWSHDYVATVGLGANVDNGVDAKPDGETTLEPIVAEIILGGDFDASRIVSTPATGFGQFREGEVVISGMKDEPIKVVSAHTRGNGTGSPKIKPNQSQGALQRQYSDRMRLSKSAFWYNGYENAEAMIVNAVREGLISARVAAVLLQLRK